MSTILQVPNYLRDSSGHKVDNFLLEVNMGKIPGASVIWEFGHTQNNTNGVKSTVWSYGDSLYAYPLGYGVDSHTITVTSNNGADNGIVINIDGLDTNGNEQSEIVEVGATSVNSFSRVYRAYNANGTPCIGDVYIHVQGTVITGIHATDVPNICAYIEAGSQNTLMALITIPNNKTGYLIKGTTSIGSGKEAVIDYSIRTFEGVFRTSERLTVFQSTVEADRPYIPIPELTDIEVRLTPSSNDVSLGASFGILLLDNNIYSSPFIGTS